MIRWVIVFCAVALSMPAEANTPTVYETNDQPIPSGQIDELVFKKLSEIDVQPVLCSDAVFVRRVYLDVIGTLPTAEEAAAFIKDKSADKRSALIDRLLERDEYPDYWAMKWSDVLRIKAEFPINLWPNAAQAYHRWVRASIAENKPYDQFVREMLTSSGSNFRVGPVNFYRAIQNKTDEGIAIAVALTFMGTRAESWPEEQLKGMASFFSQVGYKPTNEWKEENVFWDPLKTTAIPGNAAPGAAAVATVFTGKVAKVENEIPNVSAPLDAVFPDGTKVRLDGSEDPRIIFADWLINDENPWFCRSIVNRVWAWLLGRGVVHVADDFRDDNPPSNPELLDYLEKEFVRSGYDLKQLYRLILNSKTYQLSSVNQFNNPEAMANFACYPIRRLDAEVLIDAVNKITGTTELYTSAIPEPFTYLPQGDPAIAIADGSITSPFLALFGRSARATGTADERNNSPVSSQWLHMLNSGHIQKKIEQGPGLKKIISSKGSVDEIVEQLYLTILSRYPTAEELTNIKSYGSLGVAKPVASSKSSPKDRKSEAKKDAKNSPKPALSAEERKALKKARAKMTPEEREADRKARVAQEKKRRRKKAADAKKAAAEYKKIVAERRNDYIDVAWMLLNSPEFLYRH